MPNLAKWFASKRSDECPEMASTGASKPQASMFCACSNMVVARNLVKNKIQAVSQGSNDPSHRERRPTITSYDRSKHLSTKDRRPTKGELREDHPKKVVNDKKCIANGDDSKCIEVSISMNKCNDSSKYLVINDVKCMPGGLRRVPLLTSPNQSSLLSRRMKLKKSKDNIHDCNISLCTTVPEGSDREFSTPEVSECSSFTSPLLSVERALEDVKSARHANEHSERPKNHSSGDSKQPLSFFEAKRLSSWHSSFFASRSRVDNDVGNLK